MSPHIAVIFILILCLSLIIVTYVLGFEVGKSNVLLMHPGFGSKLQG